MTISKKSRPRSQKTKKLQKTTIMPISKIVRPSEIATKLQVPRKLLRILPPFHEGQHEMVLVARDGVGIDWRFRCAIRKHRHKKPCFQSKEWLDFVRSKKVQEGDKIEFNMEDNESGGKRLRIRVMRRAPHGDGYGDNYFEIYF